LIADVHCVASHLTHQEMDLAYYTAPGPTRGNSDSWKYRWIEMLGWSATAHCSHYEDSEESVCWQRAY